MGRVPASRMREEALHPDLLQVSRGLDARSDVGHGLG